VLTLASPRTDDPLAGVTVPVSDEANPSADLPSHLQKVHAELVSRLPVPGDGDDEAQLRTSADYTAYIRRRTAAWQHARARGQESSGASAPKV
jgi:phospholipase C